MIEQFKGEERKNEISEMNMDNNIAIWLLENIVLSKWFHIVNLVMT